MQGMSPSLRHGPGIAFVRNKPMIIKFIDSVQNSSHSLLTQRNLKSILKITLMHIMHISILICIICLTKLEFIPGRSFSSNKQRTKFSVSSLNKINWGHIIHQLTFITPSVKVFRSILSQAMKGKKY